MDQKHFFASFVQCSVILSTVSFIQKNGKMGLLHKIRYFVCRSFRYESEDQCYKTLYSSFLFVKFFGIVQFACATNGSLYFERTVELSVKMIEI